MTFWPSGPRRSVGSVQRESAAVGEALEFRPHRGEHGFCSGPGFWPTVRASVSTLLLVATLLACGYFLGRGIGEIARAAILPLDPGVRAVPARSPLARGLPVGPRRRDASAILARNIFDSTLGPVVNSPPQAPGPCADGLQLVATVATRAAGWSLAAIRVGGTTVLYREGQPLGMHRVSRIGWGHALLESAAGATCDLSMFGAARQDTPRPAASPLEFGIDRVGPTEFNVDRRLVQRILDDPTPLLGNRIMPYSENGRLVGVRLLGIRREDLLGRLGFENGDVLRSIDGIEVTSPERALDAFQHLLTAGHVTARLGRHGSMVVLDYDLR